jgi:hypothetical protein
MHGCAPGSGGPSGEASGRYRHGKYTKQTKELSKVMRELAHAGEALVATTMHRHGLRPVKAIRRKRHVRRAIEAAKAAAKAKEPK